VTVAPLARNVPVVLLIVAAIVGVWGMPLAVGTDPTSQKAELDAARLGWAAQRIRDYRFRLRLDCYCPAARHFATITVRRGHPRGGSGYQKKFDTVPEMFDQIRVALIDPKAGATIVRYDPRRDFPRYARIDAIKNAIDDEHGWTVDHFRVLKPTR
jgi:hypothetical protein